MDANEPTPADAPLTPLSATDQEMLAGLEMYADRDWPAGATTRAAAVDALARRYRAGESVRSPVAYDGADGQVLLSGWLRYLAVKRAGLTTIPLMVVNRDFSPPAALQARLDALAAGLRDIEISARLLDVPRDGNHRSAP